MTLYLGYEITDVEFSDDLLIRSVSIQEIKNGSNDAKTSRPLSLSCGTLLSCADKGCDYDIFSAINESGLVYDGGVVVDQVSRI